MRCFICKVTRKLSSAHRILLRQLISLWFIVKRFVKVTFFRDFKCRTIKGLDYLYVGNDGEYLAYQSYYVIGLREKVSIRKFVCYTHCNDVTRPSGKRLYFQTHATHVGQYVFSLKNGRKIKVAIDAHDHRNIRSEEILEWSDLYFKSNKWPSASYNEKVHPIVNGNGDLSLEKIRFLKSLRQQKKIYDFVFVSRIWAGGDANVEHNLRLFEKLIQVKAKFKLLAIFAGFDPSDPDFILYRRRLECAGVPWTFDHVDYKQLMLLSSQSRCTVIRAGVSGCIPWRMLDMLCLGACIIMDNLPYAEWPIPLVNQVNFLSLNLRIQPDATPAPYEDYEAIITNMNRFLNNNELQEKIRENNRVYFDTYAHPSKVAGFIIDAVLDFAGSTKGS